MDEVKKDKTHVKSQPSRSATPSMGVWDDSKDKTSHILNVCWTKFNLYTLSTTNFMACERSAKNIKKAQQKNNLYIIHRENRKILRKHNLGTFNKKFSPNFKIF